MPKDRGDEKEGMQGRVKIKPELLDEALKGYRGPQDLEEIFKEFKKAVLERALGAELSQHLGYGKGEDKPEHQSNHRNGASGKRILTDQGSLEIEVPRDRESSFEPRLIKKGERRFSGFDDKIIAMYARGMTVREIQGYLQEMYGVLVSPDLISQVTDAVMEQVREWQNRPLERLYPVVFFDALRIKIRDEGTVKNKAVYLALGVLPDGTKDILGIWIEQSEGAKFWLRVMRRHGGESPGSLRGLFPWDLGQEIPTHRADLEAAMGAGHSVFSYPAEVRKIIYTTNAIESLHMQLRKSSKIAAISLTTMLRASCSIWR
jgi:putative transposase